MFVRKLAGVFNLAAGAWLAEVGHATVMAVSGVSPAPPFIPIIVIGLVLAADSIVCFLQRWIAFPIGIALALAGIVLISLQSWGAPIEIRAITLGLPAVAIAVNATAVLSKKQSRLSQESHPLNSPVFG